MEELPEAMTVERSPSHSVGPSIPQDWILRLTAVLKKKEMNRIHSLQCNVSTTRLQELQSAQQALAEQLLDLQTEGIFQDVWTLEAYQKLQQTLVGQVQQSVEQCVASSILPSTTLQPSTPTLQPVPLLAYQSQAGELLTTTSPANLKKIPFDLLVAQADQVWLNPYISTKWQEQLVHITLPLFLGDRFKDSLTAVQWAINVSQLLFIDVGIPLREAIRVVRRCFPEKSRTKIWYARLIQQKPDVDFNDFIRLFVMTFETTADISETRTQLFNLRQRSMSIGEFANAHAQLWWLSFPNSTERELVMNWEFRLNTQCTSIFQKYLTKLLELNQSPTFDHALHHMEKKLEGKGVSSISLISSQQHPRTQSQHWPTSRVGTSTNVIPEGWEPCKLGCWMGRHREGQVCAATRLRCFTCDELGHFRTSVLCKKRKQAVVALVAEGTAPKKQKDQARGPGSGANAAQLGVAPPGPPGQTDAA